jgi:hypothetical protein
MKPLCCDRCGLSDPDHDFTHFTETAQTVVLCSNCFNAQMAATAGIEDLDTHELEPITLTDAQGARHTFYFQIRLLGTHVSLEAFELKDGYPGGYQFQDLGAPMEDRFVQLGRLVQKMRRSLGLQHLADSKYGVQIKGQEVRGRIEADLSEDADGYGRSGPMLIIDGKEIPWDMFGQMLLTFEGFQFKLEIADPSDDLDNMSSA